MNGKNWWRKWLFIGLLVRLILIPTTAHSDLWALNFGQYFFAYQNVINIYDYLSTLPPDHPLVANYGANFYTYPPLAYFSLGFFTLVLKPFYDPNFIPWLMANFSRVYQVADVFRQLFLFKLPYLVFDFGVAFLLLGLFKGKRQQRKAFLLWLFNPLTLYSTFMVGQFDILPVFCFVLSLWLAMRSKDQLAAVVLGIGGALKMFPLLFILPLVLVVGKTLKKRIWLLIVGILPYLLATGPFMGSVAYRQIVLFSPQSEKMLFARLPISGAEGIYWFVFLYFLVCYFTDYLQMKRESLWISFFAILLLFFSLTHYHPQWFLWLSPLLIIDLVNYGRRHLAYIAVLIASFLVILAFFEPSLHLGLFSPLFPSLVRLTEGLETFVIRFYDPFQLKSLARSLFAATAFFLTYLNFRYVQEKEKK